MLCVLVQQLVGIFKNYQLARVSAWSVAAVRSSAAAGAWPWSAAQRLATLGLSFVCGAFHDPVSFSRWAVLARSPRATHASRRLLRRANADDLTSPCSCGFIYICSSRSAPAPPPPPPRDKVGTYEYYQAGTVLHAWYNYLPALAALNGSARN